MKRILTIAAMLIGMALTLAAQNVTVHAENEPAADVFRSLIEQTGKNFVYSSDILKGLNVTIDADNKPLRKVLRQMFRDTGIEFKIKGNNVILKRKPRQKAYSQLAPTIGDVAYQASPESQMLDEVVVLSRLEAPAVASPEIGARKITSEEVNRTPALFGESDVVKALQMQAGVSPGVEGLAGMHVHGGEADENLYMLENVPVYQINHFGGLFSAFNTNAIRYIDFFKSSIPAKYDGRLSSFMDVRLKSGSPEGHHGSFKLGLTFGALDISGPISRNTTYMVAVRRSWLDVLTIPAVAIINASASEGIRFHYAFMDLNARVSHRFSSSLTDFANVYFGDDMLKTGEKDKVSSNYTWSEDYTYKTRWGNFVAQTGLNLRINESMSSEFTAAYTRCFSNMRHDERDEHTQEEFTTTTRSLVKTDNNINDWILRGDFDWVPSEASRVRFGASYVLHSFLPSRTSRRYVLNQTQVETRDSTWAYLANEANAYIEDDLSLGRYFRANAGLHASLFNIDGKSHFGLSPRISLNFRAKDCLAFKAAYSRTVQYVHQLARSYLALPSDQWIPITGHFKPQTADKYAIGACWQTPSNGYAISVECYYKDMHHLVDYADEFYLKPPMEMWNARLTSGSGTAKGIDFTMEKTTGQFTGHISYSLAWANRKFADRNDGHPFPARFDNRHTINVSASWQISGKVQVNAFWTGHSGNRFTLMTQSWQGWEASYGYYTTDPLKVKTNNYQLPFYHRLDLACTVQNSRGYWTFSLYNAYNHLNTVAIRRHHDNDGKPVFQKVKLLPIIPSIAYTWTF